MTELSTKNYVTGYGSEIIKQLEVLVDDELTRADWRIGPPYVGHRFIFAHGHINPVPTREQLDNMMMQSVLCNALLTMRWCDAIIEENDIARICILGSESGYKWSYDGPYAAAKTALHTYVETKRLRTKHQQIVAVSPGIISDTGMTKARKDKELLILRENEHPKKRFLRPVEVAKLIRFLLWEDDGYITNEVIRMHGGEK